MPLTWQGLFVIYSYSWFVTNPQSNINITNSWNEGVGSFGYGNSNTLLQMCISPSPTATSPQGRFSLADNLYIYSCPDLSTTATSLQRPISSVPKVAVEAGDVQLYETSPTFRGLLQAKCLGSWWRHSSFSPASSLRFSHENITSVL